MTLFKAICASLLLAMSTFVSASENDSQAIEREAAAFLDNYLSVYNRRFGHPERSAQFRRELGELVHMPFLQAPPTGKPLVPESLEAFTASFEGFVSMLEQKNVDRLEWQQVQLHVLTPNKVLANNIGRGLTVNGEVAYETISLYLLYRGEDGWKIAMFSPYYINNALSLERK